MNILDKAINAVAPVHGLKRMAARKTMDIINTGYSDGGASYTKKALKGFRDVSATPAQDIDANLRTLVNRSRSLYMNAPIATGAIKTTRTNVVGSGLKLKCSIDYEFLGLTEEEAAKWESKTQREFSLWADKRHCDALRLNNFYEMQGLIFLGQLLNGDGFCLMKYAKPAPYLPYGLRLHLIEADRICTPFQFGTPYGNSVVPFWGKNPDNGNEIYSGIEIDKGGAVVAYHICNQYPYAFSSYNFTAPEWQRVEAFGQMTGRQNIIHIFDAERAEQRRGVPMLAAVIESLKQLTRYNEAELMAAVISGMFTVFVKTDSPTSEMPLGTNVDETETIPHGDGEYEMGNAAVNIMAPNESIEIADPKRPNTAFDSFITSMCRYIGSALEIPQELLLKSFNSSYSASRAALLEAWKMFRMRREWLAKEFCQPVYELFLTEAIASGRIQAPGYFDDPITKKAWEGANWNGPAPGMIDPVKEVKAAQMRVDSGFSSYTEETIGLTGGDFVRNAKQLKREKELLDKSAPKPAPILNKNEGTGEE